MKIIFLILFATLTQAQNLLLFDDDAWTPAKVTSATLQFWFEGDVGLTTSGWTDQSGNGRNMTFTNTPTLGTKGSTPTVIFNGTDEYGRLSAFTFNQPETIVIVVKTLTFVGNDRIFDGNAGNSMGFFHTDPNTLAMYAGANIGGLGQPYGADTWDIHYLVYNGASSSYQRNGGSVGTGNVGASNAGGFNLASYNNTTLCSNIEVVAVLGFSGVLSVDDKTKLKNYLNDKYAIY
jgi:hypothetical protein